MKKLKRGLQLNKETVRLMSPSTLANVVGGNSGIQHSMGSCNPCSTYGDGNCYDHSLECPETSVLCSNACNNSWNVCN